MKYKASLNAKKTLLRLSTKQGLSIFYFILSDKENCLWENKRKMGEHSMTLLFHYSINIFHCQFCLEDIAPAVLIILSN